MKKMISALALCVLVYGQKQIQNKGAETSNNYNSISSSKRDLTIPRTLSYQGLLTKSDGRPVEDGSYSVTFRFFNSLIEGDLLWEENQSIEVKDGIISATLGSETPVDFNSEESYLEIVVEDVPLSPRQTLTSVLYSIKSDTANYSQGGDYSDLDNLPDLSVYAIKDTLANFPLINSLDSVAFTGDYNSLANTPDLTGFTQSDTLSQYTLTSALGLVALSNEYTDLNNTPDLTVYATNDTLSPVAFSNEYDDLSNTPDLTVFATNDTLNEYVLDDNVGTIASQNFDNVSITGGSVTGITDVTVADGGTGASDVATARQNLGLEIGVDVQGYDADVADLADGELSADKVQYMQNVTSDIQEQLDAVTDPGLSQIAALNSADGNIIIGSVGGWVAESGATARTSLGLGTISTQASDNVTITGGSVTGITDVTVADGGTGASDVATARQNLGLEIGVDVQGYDADLADLADGTLSASKVENGEYFIPSAGTNGQVWTSDGDGAGSWQASSSTISGSASTIDTEVLDASRAVVSNSDGNIAVSDVTSTELGYLDGVTSNVQTQLDGKQNSDINLDALAGLAHRDGNIIVSDGNTWTVESGSDARTSLGLGSIATQGADNVTITGGTVRGITDVTVADGGTGASDVATARQNLGLEIGVDVQGYDADLADLADGTLSASKVENGEYFIPSAGTNGQVWTSDGDGAGSWQASSSTISGSASTIDTEVLDASRAVVSNADGNIAVSDVTSTELGYLDGVTSNVQTQLDGKGTVSTLSDLSVTATAAELNILDGVTATTAELNTLDGITATVAELNYTDGVTSNIQTQLDGKQGTDADLTAIAGLDNSDGNVIVGSAGGWVVESGATARTSLGLGTISTQASDNVTITGGSVTGITDVTVADGGTGASDVATARQNLGLEIGVDVQGYDADLADLADGTLSASKVENGEYFIPSAGTNGQVWTSDGDGAGAWSNVTANTVSITDNENENETNALIFSSNGDVDGGEMILESDGDATYNPSTGVISASGFNGETVTVSNSVDISGSNGLILENDETITNSTDGTLLLTSTTTSLTGDLTVSGNDIVFGNGETISNSRNGVVVVAATTIEASGNLNVGDGSSSGIIASKGDFDLKIQTGNSSTGSITITDGANGNIAVSPNGSGAIQLDGLSWPTADGSANQVLKTDGSGSLSWTDVSSTISGSASTIDTEVLDASRAVVSNADGNIAVSDVTSTELGYLDGVTSNVQTQLDGKGTVSTLSDLSVTATAAELNILDGVTATTAELNTLDGITATVAELNYTDGVTSNIQTQLDGKQGTDADLTAIAGLDNSDGNVIVGSAGGWVVESGATARTSLGLGTISTQASDNVTITGGAIDGTALGGTSASTGAFTSVTASTSLDVTGSTGIILENDETITNSTDGTVLINGTVAGGTGSSAGVFTSNGDQDVTIQTGNSTTGSITITDGANGNIAITPNGTGAIQLDGLSWPTVDGSTDQVLKTDGSGTLSWSSAATSINGLSDALVEDNSTYLGNDPSSTTDDALRNVAVGLIALDAITTGDNNVAVGYNALTANTTGSHNIGIGYNALKANVGGTSNAAIGYGSLASNTSGQFNTGFGSSSLNANINGQRNVGIGNSSLRDNTSGNYNTAVGKSSGQSITTGDDNVTIGHQAGTLLTTGNYNTILGSDSDPSAEDAINQAMVGYGVTGQADNSVVLGNADVTAIYMAQDKGATVHAAGADLSGSTGLILENDETITNSTDGTVLINGTVAGGTGSAAGVFTSNGDQDVTIQTGNSTTGSITITDGANGNIAITPNGSGAIQLDGLSWPTADGSADQVLKTDGSGTLSWTAASSGASNVNGLSDALIEDNSLYLGQDPSSTTSTAEYNLSVGATALDAVTTGDYNTALGHDALSANTTGTTNTAVGHGTLKHNVEAGANTAVGDLALRQLKTSTAATYNTAVGRASQRGPNNEAQFHTGERNTSVGAGSMKVITTGNDNTAVGYWSQYGASITGDYNTSIGSNSLKNLDSGDKNISVGHEAGDVITSGSNNVIIGSGSDPSASSASNQTVIGYNVTGQADNSVVLGNADVTAIYMAQDKGATVHAAGADLSGSTGLILENDETITNSTDGTVLINGTVAGGTGSAAGVFTSNGDQDVTIQTGNSTTGSITITDGANGNIAITPNGSGAIQLDGLSWPTADGSADQVLKTDGSGTLSWTAAGSGASNVNGLSDALIEDNSLYLGQDPSSTTSTAEYNLSVGATALDAVTTGDYNTALGYDALSANTTGSGNLAIGYGAYDNADTEGNNMAIGRDALGGSINGGETNIAIGNYSLDANTSGDLNIGLGYVSLTQNSTGSSNVGIGNSAMQLNQTGSSNTTLGNNSMKSSLYSSYNTAVGAEALFDANRTADTDGYNTALGYNAGNTGTNDITTGNKNTLLGASTATSAAAGTNQTVIGFGASGTADNSVTIGNSSVTAWYPGSDDTADLGSNSVEFKDLYIDGTANLDAVDIDGGAIDGTAIGANSASTGAFTTITASTSLDVTGSTGIILENDETITNSTDTQINMSSTTLVLGNGSNDPTIQSNGNKDLTLKTGATNTGSIVIRDGSNNNIDIAPHGTGKVDMNDSPLTGYGADLQTESGTSKTLAASDNGTIIVCSSNSAVTITVPASLPAGFNCMIIQSGSGQVSLSASSTTLNNRNGTKTAGQHAIMTVVHLGSDAYVVSGDTSSS